MVPRGTTIEAVERELEGATVWATSHGVYLTWHPDNLEIRVAMEQPSTRETFYLLGRFDNYREEPPAWLFCDERWAGITGRSFFPHPHNATIGSTFLNNSPNPPVICAPFNRLAYSEHAGPHSNWGGAAQWITPKGRAVYAVAIGDMLQAIRRDLVASKGRME